MTTTTPRKQPPQPGQAWTMADALVSLLADTPVTVTAVRGGVVHFTTASGVRSQLREGTFRGLLDPVPS